MKKNIFLFFVFLACFFSVFGESFACKCMISQDAKTEMEKSDAVFVGSVKDIQKDSMVHKISFDVSSSYKGTQGTALNISTNSESAACGVSFEKGKEYLVYAYKNENGSLSTNLCTRTALASTRSDDIGELQAESRLKKLGEMCGGIAGFQCQENLSCKLDGNYPDAAGTCVKQEEDPIMCPMIYAPVCGVDGKTYGNSCMAGKNPISYTGECNSAETIQAKEKNVSKKNLETLQLHITGFTKKISPLSSQEKNTLIESVLQKAETAKKKLTSDMNHSSQPKKYEKMIEIIELLELKIAALKN